MRLTGSLLPLFFITIPLWAVTTFTLNEQTELEIEYSPLLRLQLQADVSQPGNTLRFELFIDADKNGKRGQKCSWRPMGVSQKVRKEIYRCVSRSCPVIEENTTKIYDIDIYVHEICLSLFGGIYQDFVFLKITKNCE